MLKLAAFAAMLVGAIPAQAAMENSVDLYYANQTLTRGYSLYVDEPTEGYATTTDLDFDGDAFGVRGRFGFDSGVFLAGQYEAGSYSGDDIDTADVDFNDLRLGGGYGLRIAPAARLLGQLDYVTAEWEVNGSSSDLDGFGIYIGLEGDLSRSLQAYGRAGVLQLDAEDSNKFDGTEFLLGIAGMFGSFGVFGEYRALSLEDEYDQKLDLDGFRAGVRFRF